jgi:hypothetical protein
VKSPDSLPNGGLVSGRDAVLENFKEIPSYWSSFSVEPLEYIDAGEHVVVTGMPRATGPGGSFESRYLHLFTLSGGKVVRGESIGDSAKARDALCCFQIERPALEVGRHARVVDVSPATRGQQALLRTEFCVSIETERSGVGGQPSMPWATWRSYVAAS